MATEPVETNRGGHPETTPRVSRSVTPVQAIPPLPGAPTKEEADAANAGEYAPTGAESLLHRLARNWVVRLGLVGGTSYVAYQAVPAIHEYVDTRYQDLLQWLNLKTETVVPPTFDNTLNEGVIGDNNTLDLSPSEINQRFPNAIEEGHFLDFLSFMVLPDGTKMPYIKQDVWNIPGGANYETEELNEQARKNNIKDMMEMTIPAGTILISPVDGYGYIDMDKDIPGHDPNLASAFFVVFRDEVKNKTYKIWVFGHDLKTTNYNLVSLAPDLEMPANFPAAQRGDTAWKNWPRMKRGQPLIQATKDQLIRVRLEAYNGENIGGRATVIYKTRYLVTPRFYTDPATGKLVALGK